MDERERENEREHIFSVSKEECISFIHDVIR